MPYCAPVTRSFFSLLACIAATALGSGCSDSKTACSCTPDDNRITVDNGCWTGVTVTTAGWCLATWGPPDADAAACQSSAWVTPIGDGLCTVWIDLPDGRRYQTDFGISTDVGECCPGQHLRMQSPTVAVEAGTP